jgi:hypothetical protein
MRKILMAAGFLAAAVSQGMAQDSHVPSGGYADPRGYYAPAGGSGHGVRAKVILVNAPGGSYIDCDPRNPNSPIRCTPDGW